MPEIPTSFLTPEIIHNRQDVVGYYRVGNQKFYSKLQAIELAQQTGCRVSWHFNDEIYGLQDWQTEPSESLADLYRERALQLREQYDYLVLWFSGGADSTNILDTFLDNGIKLDEVASFVNYEATGDKFNYLNAEIYNVAAPRIEQAKISQPWLTHRLVDISQATIDRFQEKETRFDWIYLLNNAFNPNHTARQNIKLLVPEWRRMFDAGKRVGFIYGIDKPRVSRVNDRYFFRFYDMIDIAISPAVQIWNRPWEFDELFYWSPSCPRIVIKQAHVLKKFLQHVPADSSDMTLEMVGVVSEQIRDVTRWIKMDSIHRLIYPSWQPVPFQSKPRSLIFTPRDTWFFRMPQMDQARQAWQMGLEKLWQSIDDRWKNPPGDLSLGLRLIGSRLYDLGS